MTPPIPPRPETFWGPVLGTTQPDQHLSEDHEVLIVGAGITGLTTALLLARAGLDVAVVDAHRPGGGTTAKSTAKASLLHSTLSGKIRAKHGDQALEHYLAANVSGQDLISEIVNTTGIVDTQVRDAWTYATTKKGAKEVREEFDALSHAGLPAELATPSELPFEVEEAVCLPDQLQINPAQYLTALHAEVSALGVPVVWPHRVAMVDAHGDHMHATSAHGLTTKAKWIVLATLIPFPLRTLAFAASSPMRSYAMAARVNGAIPQGMYLSADSPSHSLRTATTPSGEEVLLIGGHGHTVGRQNPTSQHVQDLADWGAQNFPIGSYTHRWSAQDFSSAHLLPQVGPSPLGPRNLLIATGFGKWGITNGSAAAQAITGHILGAEPEWAQVYKPRAAGWRKIASLNAKVGFTLAKGWLVEPHEGKGVRAGLPAPRAVSHVDGVRRECSAVCTHLGGIVRWNDAEKSWDCPLHGSRFEPDGTVIDGPAVSALDGIDAEAVSSQRTPGAA